MFDKPENRLDRIVADLLRGRRLRLRASDAPDREAILAAAQLAAAREGHPRMSPAFRRRLAALVAGGDPGLVSRRTALGAVAGLAAGVAGAAALGELARGEAAAHGATRLAGGLMKPGGGRWVPVAAFADLSEGVPTRVVAGDLVAFLFREGRQVRGVSGLCSHPGWPCILGWRPEAGTLNCSCHNVDFAPDGNTAVTDYDVPPLPSVQVKVERGVVMVLSP